MNYFVLFNGEQLGPFSEKQVRDMAAAGKLKSTDLAWRDGLAEWGAVQAVIPGLPVQFGRPAEAGTTAAPAPTAETATASASSGNASKPASSSTSAEPQKSRAALWLMLAGAVVLLGLVGAVGLGGYLYWKDGQLEESSKAYVDSYVTSIAPAWSADDFVNRVAPQYRDQFKRDALDGLFTQLSHLGALTKYEGSTGDVHMGVRTMGQNAMGHYAARAQFEHGEVTFEFVVLRVNDQWTMAGIRVVPAKHR